MGIGLIVEVLDAAPAALTPRERYALVVLAETARDDTRQCWPGIEDDPKLVRRLRLSRTQRYAVIKALVDKGALEHVGRGQKHVRAVYKINQFGAQRPENPDPEADLSIPETGTLNRSQHPENRDPERVDTSPQRPETQDAEPVDNSPQGPETGDAEPVDEIPQRPGFAVSASRFSSLSVPQTGTPLPQSPQYSSSLSAPERVVRAAGLVPEHEERDFITWVHEHHHPRGTGWWRALSANGDLADIAAEWRAVLTPPLVPHNDLAAELTAARANPDLECDHRPGGLHRRTDTGRLLCPQCQLAATPREAAS